MTVKTCANIIKGVGLGFGIIGGIGLGVAASDGMKKFVNGCVLTASKVTSSVKEKIDEIGEPEFFDDDEEDDDIEDLDIDSDIPMAASMEAQKDAQRFDPEAEQPAEA